MITRDFDPIRLFFVRVWRAKCEMGMNGRGEFLFGCFREEEKVKRGATRAGLIGMRSVGS